MIDKRATSVIGIDQAIRHTGIAVWRDGVLSTMTVHTTDKMGTYEERIRWITGNIWPLLTRQTFVVLETPFVSGNSETSMALAGLYYIVRYGLYARSVPFGCIGNSRLKMFATGHGNADKPAMVQQAAATFGAGAGLRMGHWRPPGRLDNVDAVSHEADALWAMTAGLYHMRPEADVMEPGLNDAQVAVHRKAAVDWPDIDWEAPA